MVVRWLRFAHAEGIGFGTLTDGLVAVCEGDLFAGATPTGQVLSVGSMKPGSTVEVEIAGIGKLVNRFE